jgi:hypothetical protein
VAASSQLSFIGMGMAYPRLNTYEGKITRAPIIGATCAFDAKIYKNVDMVFAVSLCLPKNKKFFQISDFCFQLQADLVDFC